MAGRYQFMQPNRSSAMPQTIAQTLTRFPSEDARGTLDAPRPAGRWSERVSCDV
jgi:hypothetical protein